MKKPKPGKTKMITFLLWIQDSKTVFEYEIQQKFVTCEIFYSEIYIYEYDL